MSLWLSFLSHLMLFPSLLSVPLYCIHSILTDVPLYPVCSCISFALPVPSTQDCSLPTTLTCTPHFIQVCALMTPPQRGLLQLSSKRAACIPLSCFLVFSRLLAIPAVFYIYLLLMVCLAMRVATCVTSALNCVTLETFKYLLNE